MAFKPYPSMDASYNIELRVKRASLRALGQLESKIRKGLRKGYLEQEVHDKLMIMIELRKEELNNNY